MNRPDPIKVSELNKYIKNLIDDDARLNNVYIKGEISNFKRHFSGHLYFTLKDESSLIKCVMFKTYTSYLNFEPQDGMSVVILGQVSVFERDGVYQIYAKGMEQDGIGALYEAYEKLKEKLAQEGLFDEGHKKKIPMLPKRIGVVTSKTGAVIRDIINVTTRRFPNIQIVLYPASVQGKGAEKTIAQGIEFFNRTGIVDTIIIGRGGGSLEDLWPFNEELLARAIYASKIPIISAVGHETDFSISDFVSDLRAPTPSAAGELAVMDMKDIKWKINSYQKALANGLMRKLENMKGRFNSVVNSKAFKNPTDQIKNKMLVCDNLAHRLKNSYTVKLKENKIKYISLVGRLEGLSPLKTMMRGYSIISDDNGSIIKSVATFKENQEINIRLIDGERKARII